MTSKYTSALTPTRPTFLRSPAPAMPCTTTQNTIGATIIEISFKKASLKIFRLMAKSGAATPSTIPSSSATRTWTNSEVYSGFRAIGAAAEMVDIGRFPLVQDLNCRKKEQQPCQPVRPSVNYPAILPPLPLCHAVAFFGDPRDARN